MAALINPEHATGGWELSDDGQHLVKRIRNFDLRIRATTPQTYSWTAYHGSVVCREASCIDIHQAKRTAEAWASGSDDQLSADARRLVNRRLA